METKRNENSQIVKNKEFAHEAKNKDILVHSDKKFIFQS